MGTSVGGLQGFLRHTASGGFRVPKTQENIGGRERSDWMEWSQPWSSAQPRLRTLGGSLSAPDFKFKVSTGGVYSTPGFHDGGSFRTRTTAFSPVHHTRLN